MAPVKVEQSDKGREDHINEGKSDQSRLCRPIELKISIRKRSAYHTVVV